MADRDPRRNVEAVAAVAEIARRHGAAVHNIADPVQRRYAAGYLGWALARLPSGQELTRLGVELLELAVELGATVADRISQSFTLSNLANAYRALARFESQEERLHLLQHAHELLCQVAATDEELRRSADPREHAAGDTLDLDHMNVGLVCESLANATYDASLISRKPLDSARHLRDALLAFGRSVELAMDRPAIRATAELGLARCCTALCRHYYQERQWAAGDLERAFYDWICEVAEGPVGTWALIEGAAETALDAASSAAEYGVAGNPSLLVEAAGEIAALWGVLRRTDELPEHVRLHCTLTVAE
jgi:hypothetical protein